MVKLPGLENGPAGVWGEHKGAGIGVKAVSNTGVGLVAFSHGTAAIFQGDVEVTGDIRLTNADCAEDFTIGTEVAVNRAPSWCWAKKARCSQPARLRQTRGGRGFRRRRVQAGYRAG